MTDHAPDQDTVSEPDGLDAVGAVKMLWRAPGSVSDALDVHARLSALEAWAAQRKQAVRDWTLDRAKARKDEDGGAPTWRFDDGTVSMTDPKPTPKIVDSEAFARWWLVEIEGRDPDEERADHEAAFTTDLGTIVRRTVATAYSDDLLAFLDGMDGHAVDQFGGTVAAADRLAGKIHVDVEWLLPSTALAHALDTAAGGPTRDDGTARLVVVGGHAVIDRDSGQEVPGTDVSPPSDSTVVFRPTPDTKQRLGDELHRLIGPPALTE